MKDKKEIKKEKKKINITNLILNIFTGLDIVSMLFLSYTLILLSNIERGIIIVGIITIILVNVLIILLLRKLMKNGKLYKYIIYLICIFIMTIAQLFIGYYIFRSYSLVAGLNKNKIEYTSELIVLKDSKISDINELNKNKIGIITDETSIDYNIIPEKVISTNKLKKSNEIIEYDDSNEMLDDLYNKNIDAAFVGSNYINKFSKVSGFEKISSMTKSIFSKTISYTKNKIAKLTGDTTLSSNSNDKITEPFTVLLMGIDSTDKVLDKDATGNGDALMLVTFNPKTLNATIMSIPRDSYVPIACFAGQKENKITHAAWNGESCMIKTIENFTGINIDYYAKINFKGLTNLVDLLGGIEVDVPMEFCEQDSDRSFSNQQCLKKGLQTLNGEQALALARHRKTLATGDLQRGLNQQLVIKGILNKIKTIKSANQALKMLEGMSNYMDTNFTTNQILSFYDIAKRILLTSSSDNIVNIDQLYLSGSTQGIYDEGMRLVLSDYIVNQSSLKQDIAAMKKNLGLSEATMQKKINFNIEDPYEKEIIGTNNLSGTALYNLLPNFVGGSSSYAKSWLAANGITANIEERVVSSSSGYSNGKVIEQSFPQYKRLDLMGGSITLVVAKVESSAPVTTPEDNLDDNVETPTETPTTEPTETTPVEGNNE